MNGKPLEPDPSFESVPRRVVVKLKSASANVRAESARGSMLGDAFRQLRTLHPQLAPRPYFTTADEAPLRRAEGASRAAGSADGPMYYVIECPDDVDPEQVADAVRTSADVDVAYPESRPAPPPAVVPGDDPLNASQGYLDAAPVGIDARWAWTTAGTDGHGVRFVDVEYGWTLDHEDLAAARIQLLSGQNDIYRGHGTAVLGEVVAFDNTVGCVGIAPRATASVVSQRRPDSTYNTADAILHAANSMRPGDVLLIEAQHADRSTGAYVPVEIDQTVFDVIKSTTSRGIIVVEAACNGIRNEVGIDLDQLVDAGGRRVLNRNSPDARDSGAILVGAASSGSAHGRLAFSNFGSRVDCFAWGEHVQTCGDGRNGTSTTEYTSGFGGTSAASPIVAGAAVLLQARRIGAGLAPYTPEQMRHLLATPEWNTASANPAADRIGVMPNLRAIIEREIKQPLPAPAPTETAQPAPQPVSLFPRPVWMSYLALAGLTALNALLPGGSGPPPPSAGKPSGPQVDFTTSSAVEVTRYQNAEATAMVFVRNDEDHPVNVRFHAALVGHSGDTIDLDVGNGVVPGRRVHPLSVRLPLLYSNGWAWDSRLPARGSLMLEATNLAGKTVRIRDITVPQVQPAFPELVVTVLGLLPAVSLIAFGWLQSAKVQAVEAPQDAPPWTPRSWSSNLAIGGALLTALLGIGALPAHTHYMARSSYSVLSPFFAALVALAPAVYDLLKAAGPVPPASALRLFALAASVTLWATVGQLGTASLLFLELAAAGAISSAAATAAVAAVAAVAFAVVVYAFRAINSYVTLPVEAVQFEQRGVAPIRSPRPWSLI